MNVYCLTDAMPAPAARPGPPVKLHLAEGVIKATQRLLCEGSDGWREAIVLWAGRADGDGTALVSHVVAPLFDSGPDWLTIPLEERSVVVQFVRRERLLLFADLHTHPRGAFLSPADRARPFSARRGFYAVVIPDFAQGSPGDGWRFYEADADATWPEVRARERVDGWSI
jgi:hypothetical protein